FAYAPCLFYSSSAASEIYTLSLHDALPISALPAELSRRGTLSLTWFDKILASFYLIGQNAIDLFADHVVFRQFIFKDIPVDGVNNALVVFGISAVTFALYSDMNTVIEFFR